MVYFFCCWLDVLLLVVVIIVGSFLGCGLILVGVGWVDLVVWCELWCLVIVWC